jgi:hypothetical protein
MQSALFWFPSFHCLEACYFLGITSKPWRGATPRVWHDMAVAKVLISLVNIFTQKKRLACHTNISFDTMLIQTTTWTDGREFSLYPYNWFPIIKTYSCSLGYPAKHFFSVSRIELNSTKHRQSQAGALGYERELKILGWKQRRAPTNLPMK